MIDKAALEEQIQAFRDTLSRRRYEPPAIEQKERPSKEEKCKQQSKYTAFIDKSNSFLSRSSGPRLLTKETQTEQFAQTQREAYLQGLVARLQRQLQRREMTQRTSVCQSAIAGIQERVTVEQLTAQIRTLEHENDMLRKQLAKRKRADLQEDQMSHELQNLISSQLSESQAHQETENESKAQIENELESLRYQFAMQAEENSQLRLKIVDLESCLAKVQLDKRLANVWTPQMIPPNTAQSDVNEQCVIRISGNSLAKAENDRVTGSTSDLKNQDLDDAGAGQQKTQNGNSLEFTEPVVEKQQRQDEKIHRQDDVRLEQKQHAGNLIRSDSSSQEQVSTSPQQEQSQSEESQAVELEEENEYTEELDAPEQYEEDQQEFSTPSQQPESSATSQQENVPQHKSVTSVSSDPPSVLPSETQSDALSSPPSENVQSQE